MRQRASLYKGVIVSVLLALTLVFWALRRASRPRAAQGTRALAEVDQRQDKGRRRWPAVAGAGLVLALAALAALMAVQDHSQTIGEAVALDQATALLPLDPWARREPAAPPVAAAELMPSLQGGDNPSPLSSVDIPLDLRFARYQAPENQGASPDFRALADTLREEIEAYRQRLGRIDVAIAVTDLQTGETISVNGNDLHRTACTINMFALFVATEAFQNGEAQPEDVVAAIRTGIGASFPPEVKRFLQAIKGSYQLGVQRANELMRLWGLEASTFDHVPYYGDGTQNNLLTARETNLVLTKLYRGELFQPEWTQYAVERLRDIKPYLNYMLPAQLPSGVTVAHKIGYYWDYDGWVNNDAGVVTFQGNDGQEKAYVITYLSERSPTEYSGYSFGARLSKIVFDYFDAKYGATSTAAVSVPSP